MGPVTDKASRRDHGQSGGGGKAVGGDAEETFEYRNAAEKLKNVQHERAVACFSPTPTTATATTTTVANKRCCCCCCVFFTKPCLLGRVYSQCFFLAFSVSAASLFSGSQSMRCQPMSKSMGRCGPC